MGNDEACKMHLICHHGSCHPFSVWSHAPYIPSAISNLYIRIQTHFKHSPFCGAKRHPRVWLRKAFFPWVVNQIRSEAKGWHSLPKIGRIPGYVWRIWSDMNQIASILVAQFAFRTSRKTLTFSQVSPLSWINAADSVAQYKEKKSCSQEQAAIPSSRFRHIPPQEYDDKPKILPKWCLLPQAGTPK